MSQPKEGAVGRNSTVRQQIAYTPKSIDSRAVKNVFESNWISISEDIQCLLIKKRCPKGE